MSFNSTNRQNFTTIKEEAELGLGKEINSTIFGNISCDVDVLYLHHQPLFSDEISEGTNKAPAYQ